MTQSYGGRVEFVSENWGESKLAERFGLKRYPNLFVDDVLLARPDDFGWFGNKGRYTPWNDPANHERFKKDLARLVDLELGGDVEGARAAGATAEPEAELAALPKLTLREVGGTAVDTASLSGKIVAVEFWATWCLPCRSTLDWLGKLKQSYGEKLAVLAIALESSETDVNKLASSLHLPYRPILATPEVGAAFGSISSIPTLYVFGKDGKRISTFYGAPEDLHEKAGRAIDSQILK